MLRGGLISSSLFLCLSIRATKTSPSSFQFNTNVAAMIPDRFWRKTHFSSITSRYLDGRRWGRRDRQRPQREAGCDCRWTTPGSPSQPRQNKGRRPGRNLLSPFETSQGGFLFGGKFRSYRHTNDGKILVILLTNCDLNKAIEADVVDVCVEEDVCEEAPYFSAPGWVIFGEGAETFNHSWISANMYCSRN